MIRIAFLNLKEGSKAKRYQAVNTLLKQKRLELGVSQVDLAIRAGIPSSMLCRLERGEKCSRPTAIKIAEALGVPAREIFGDLERLRQF